MGIVLSVVGSTLLLLNAVQRAAPREAERADLQQRLRVASDALHHDLAMAGAGGSRGSQSRSLDFFVASVLPFRQGGSNADPAGTFKPDTITLLYVPRLTSAASTIRESTFAQSASVRVNLGGSCPPGDPVCGFGVGADVMIFDDRASYDTFRIVGVQADVLQLQHTMIDSPLVYQAGANIVEIVSHTYSLQTDAATGSPRLMRDDGAADVPLVDHVVGLAFEYYGESSPPVLVRPVTERIGPWTTYGPKPPPLDVQSTLYPPGENCVFRLDPNTGEQIPRLAVLGGGTTGTLARLTEQQLTDGPWCPDESSANHFDADLLRVRRITAVLRVEAALTALRGPAGVLFARGGTAADARSQVPDREVRFDVTPRNLNFGR